MPKLGELLVAARVVTRDQLDNALRAQVVWGGRLGTNLVELGAIDLDTLARALGRQRDLLAALARHFDNADRALQECLPAELAARWRCVPLVALSDGTVAIAAIDPLDLDARTAIAYELGIPPKQLVVSVAPELRVHYHLERVYKIPRDSRFVRSLGPSVTPFPHLDVDVFGGESDADLAIPIEVEPEVAPVPADDAEIPLDLGDVIEEASPLPAARPRSEPGRERRTYVKTLADVADAAHAPGALGRIALRKVAVETTDIPRIDKPTGTIASFGDATRAIRRAPDRERVAALVVDALDRFVPACTAAVVLVVRGDVAFAWRWLSRGAAPPPELAVPMGKPGAVPSVCAKNATVRLPASELGAIDRLLYEALGAPGQLVVVPIAIGGRVMCMVAATTAPGAPIAEIEAVATAAGTAFARLMRDASR